MTSTFDNMENSHDHASKRPAVVRESVTLPTISASKFMATCLELMDDLAARHPELIVTKRGRPAHHRIRRAPVRRTCLRCATVMLARAAMTCVVRRNDATCAQTVACLVSRRPIVANACLHRRPRRAYASVIMANRWRRIWHVLHVDSAC